MGFREHGVMLFLDKPLYLAFIQLQADQKLGRSYAGLLPFTEGLYTMGYLSKEDYVEHRKRYSEKLDTPKEVKVNVCGFCHKTAVALYRDASNNHEQYVCQFHAGALADSDKWTHVTDYAAPSISEPKVTVSYGDSEGSR